MLDRALESISSSLPGEKLLSLHTNWSATSLRFRNGSCCQLNEGSSGADKTGWGWVLLWHIDSLLEMSWIPRFLAAGVRAFKVLACGSEILKAVKIWAYFETFVVTYSPYIFFTSVLWTSGASFLALQCQHLPAILYWEHCNSFHVDGLRSSYPVKNGSCAKRALKSFLSYSKL